MFNVKLLEADGFDNAGALTAGRQVTTVRSRLYSIVAFSTNAAAQYIQVFDSATTPANGAVPIMQMKVAADSQASLDFVGGRQFNAGIWVGNSTTSGTKTAGVADCLIDTAFRKTA